MLYEVSLANLPRVSFIFLLAWVPRMHHNVQKHFDASHLKKKVHVGCSEHCLFRSASVSVQSYQELHKLAEAPDKLICIFKNSVELDLHCSQKPTSTFSKERTQITISTLTLIYTLSDASAADGFLKT